MVLLSHLFDGAVFSETHLLFALTSVTVLGIA